MFKAIEKTAKLVSVVGLVLGLAQVGCGQGPQSPGQITQAASISECGGFARENSALLAADTAGYCDAEVLNWQFDAASQTLKLFDNRILLNCCGDHDMVIEEQNGVYVVTETDAPKDGSRCACMCVFDFGVEAKGIASGTIPLKIVRIVENPEMAADEKVVFEGSVDLTAGSGSVVLDESDAAPWCEEEQTLTLTQSVSECGGFGGQKSPLYSNPQDYCAAEILHWQYDEATQALNLLDSRTLLNCCGDHAITMEEKDGVYVVTETDDPENGSGRCACMCVFDFNLKAEGIAKGAIQLQIKRIIRNPEIETEEKLVFEGGVDLSQGSGSVVLDETDVYPWCGQE